MKKNIFLKQSLKDKRSVERITPHKSAGCSVWRITVFLLVISVLATACNKPEKPTLLTVSNSVLSACQSADKSDDSTLIYQYEDGVLLITHELLLNCASSSVAIEASVSGDVITIDYTVDDNISANCLCSKTLDYSILDVPAGAYTLVFFIDGSELLRQDITI